LVPPPPDQGDASGLEFLAGEHCDTNELRGIGVEQGSTITLLHGVAGLTGHPLAIPEMVLREYLGSYRRDVAAARATIAMEGESAACLRGIVCPSGGEFVLHLTVIVQEPTAWTSKN
jgi:hypothetical protein